MHGHESVPEINRFSTVFISICSPTSNVKYTINKVATRVGAHRKARQCIMGETSIQPELALTINMCISEVVGFGSHFTFRLLEPATLHQRSSRLMGLEELWTFWALKMRRNILNSVLDLTGSQCGDINVGEICSLISVLVRNVDLLDKLQSV